MTALRLLSEIFKVLLLELMKPSQRDELLRKARSGNTVFLLAVIAVYLLNLLIYASGYLRSLLPIHGIVIGLVAVTFLYYYILYYKPGYLIPAALFARFFHYVGMTSFIYVTGGFDSPFIFILLVYAFTDMLMVHILLGLFAQLLGILFMAILLVLERFGIVPHVSLLQPNLPGGFLYTVLLYSIFFITLLLSAGGIVYAGYRKWQQMMELNRALEHNEFTLHYQPQMDSGTGQITGVEALIRWQHPAKGMVFPSVFIPIAEETGFIVSIGEWVLRTACAQNKAWQEMGFPHIRMCVNLSARQFSQENLVDMVGGILKETGLEPRCLDLEITESTAMKDAEAAIVILQKLKSLGVHISIDDFGTGYSSLSYLKKFPVDALKIHQSFVADVPRNADDAAIVEAVIALADSLKLRVIAEGVETEEQLDFLKSHRCYRIQGYYFNQAMPVDDFSKLLREVKR